MRRFPLATKVLTLLLVILLLYWALSEVGGLVKDRRWHAERAQSSVAASLASSQVLYGPVIRTECTELFAAELDANGKAVHPARENQRLFETRPEKLHIEVDSTSQALERGLHKVNTYVARVKVQTDFTGVKPPVNDGGRLKCQPSKLIVGLSDSRGIRSVDLRFNDEAVPVSAGSGHANHAVGFHGTLPDAAIQQPFKVAFDLELLGNTDLSFVPLADDNEVKLRSNWPHPAFGGRFLPETREVNSEGFRATWRISGLATSVQSIGESDTLCSKVLLGEDEDWSDRRRHDPNCVDSFGVSFIDPVNPYSLTNRALKYGMLFVFLSFVAVGLVEVLRRLRVHPVQYLLVGLALSTFFLLLLSLSEHLPFHWAYTIASTACVTLLTYYAKHILGGWRLGVAFGAAMAVLYGMLFALLQLEEASMLLGALLLFTVLAAVMVLTRRIDWYELSKPEDSQCPPAN